MQKMSGDPSPEKESSDLSMERGCTQTDSPASGASKAATEEGKESQQAAQRTSPAKAAVPSAAELTKVLRGVRLGDDGSANNAHLFWDTQPVLKASEVKSITAADEGPIDATKTIEDVRKEPYRLPQGFVWTECPVGNPELYQLLSMHYVEDDDNLFRFNYGREFLVWALDPPGAIREWIIGVRVEATNKLVGFITAIPTLLSCNGKILKVAEVNFLCVHKKLRSKRLAPVLIKEITRRVNSKGIWQAVYTAGVVLPTPVAECRYWHRSLNPKKLVEVGFSGLGQRMTISRSIKLYKASRQLLGGVREEPALEGLRPMKETDAPQVHKLLMTYLKNFKLHPHFTEEEIRHWLTPRDNVVHVYVRQHKGKRKITDLTSFYELPSSVIGHPKHKEVKAAYSFYNVATSVPLKELMQDALCLAKQKDFDVFNALDVMDNKALFEDLKFGVGDGFLRYYLYNWRCPQASVNRQGVTRPLVL
ncbi:hypothetical protein Efla_003936 [Eimeria flavescens]